jgi:hypothetical protein
VGFKAAVEPCPECGSEPGAAHAEWCLYEEGELEDA